MLQIDRHISAIRKLMQTLKNQMTEVQDRTEKKVKKIYEISRHYKLLKTETLDGIKLLRKHEVLQEKVNVTVVSERI